MKTDQHGNLVKVIAYAQIILYLARNRISPPVLTMSHQYQLTPTKRPLMQAILVSILDVHNDELSNNMNGKGISKETQLSLARNLCALSHDHTYASKNFEFRPCQEQLIIEPARSIATVVALSSQVEVIPAEVGKLVPIYSLCLTV